jgi:hypothetical protein
MSEKKKNDEKKKNKKIIYEKKLTGLNVQRQEFEKKLAVFQSNIQVNQQALSQTTNDYLILLGKIQAYEEMINES